MRRWPSALLLLIPLAVGGCGNGGLQFRQDDRVDITAPTDRARVVAPLDVRWTTKGRRVRCDRKCSAIISSTDGAPCGSSSGTDNSPAGLLTTIKSSSSYRIESCCSPALRGRPADRFIYLTRKTSLTLDTLPAKSTSNRTSAKDTHDVTIVLVDADGRRRGESSWSVEFTTR